MSDTILKIAIPTYLKQPLDYLAPEHCDIKKLQIGIRIRVPFRKKTVVGILTDIADKSTLPLSKLKAAIEIIDEAPVLSPSLLQLTHWASDYYHSPLGEVIFSALPRFVREGRPLILKTPIAPLQMKASPLPVLNEDQTRAVETVTAQFEKFTAFLLHGVTGSGKTEVYLHIITEVLKKGLQALVIVPEISLTPQTIARFQERFPVPIAVFHSHLTDTERFHAWLMTRENLVPIIIGTRSAIFAPLLKPGIIIIDEEHDASLKQQEGFRYSARDLATVRARHEKIPIVLGSATPSLESFYNVEQKRYSLLQLPQRAGQATQPHYRLIDLRNQYLEEGIAPLLLQSIHSHLEKKGQVLVFLNRRGFAPVLLCHPCGWNATCRHCDAALTLHHEIEELLCHHCGHQQKRIHQCPQCHSTNLLPMGVGTERLEKFLKKSFPHEMVVRIDRDSTRRKGSLEKFLDAIHAGEARILIGTQMLAKGHHFPRVTLSAILNADSGLYSADFRATERVVQLITQVAGRSGREKEKGEVIIQTHNPEHPLLQTLLQQGYSEFARLALQERQSANLPPFTYLALFRAEAIKKEVPLDFLQEIKQFAAKMALPLITLMGPIPAPMEKRAGRFRAQLLFQATQRTPLHTMLQQVLKKIETMKISKNIRWSLDVDPIELI